MQQNISQQKQVKIKDFEIIKATEQITIKISDPSFNSQGGYTTYLITGIDKFGQFQIRRRFNEFYLLRQTLARYWIGCYIPPVPSKKMIGNKQQSIIFERRKQLQYFCLKISKKEHLYYCEIFQWFLRNKQVSIQKFAQLQFKSMSEMVQIFKSIYSQYQNSFQIKQARQVMIKFRNFINLSLKQLTDLKNQANEINELQKQFNNKLNICNIIVMPDYESEVLGKYSKNEQNLYYYNNIQINESIMQLKDYDMNYVIFEYLVDLIYFELKQLKAFKECIQLIQQNQDKIRRYEQKIIMNKNELQLLNNGRTSLKIFFSWGRKQGIKQNLQKMIKQQQEKVQQLKNITNINIKVLAQIQIPNFKYQRIKLYFQIIANIAKINIHYSQIYHKILLSLYNLHSKISL